MAAPKATVGLSAFARFRSEHGTPTTKQDVAKAIKSGRISKTDVLAGNFKKAASDWQRNTDEGRRKASKPKLVEISSADRPAATEPAEPPAADVNDFQKSRAAREYWDAENARLKAEKGERRLIPRSEVLAKVGDLIITAKTNLRGIGAKIAPDLAAEADAGKCQAMVDAEIDEALGKITQWAPPA